jgi:hypothetical protein
MGERSVGRGDGGGAMSDGTPRPKGDPSRARARRDHIGSVELDETMEQYMARYGALALYLPEFIAVRAGLKRSLQITLTGFDGPEAGLERVQTWCEQAGLHCTPFVRDGSQKVLIALEPLPAPQAGTDENADNRLTYPACCTANFKKRAHEYYFITGLRDLLTHGHRYAFEVNPFLVSTPFHLLSHFPCSLGCEATLGAARELLALLEARAPALHAGIVRWCSRPVLHLDVCGVGLVLDGALRGEEVSYRGVQLVGAPAGRRRKAPGITDADVAQFEAVARAVAEGDGLSLRAGRLEVRRGGAAVATFTEPPHLAWALVGFDG